MATDPDPLFAEGELRSLLERDEGQFLEFKSLWDLSCQSRRQLDRRQARDIVAEAVAAFANADGGTLLLGVVDDGTPSGHGYPPDAVDDLLAVTERRLRPPVRCARQRADLDGHEVVIVQVPIAPEAVMVEANGFPYRVGDRVVREPQEVINARKETYRREMPEYPEFAWQEAIVNAFAHRDYEDQGREIEVWFFEDRMEVKSPGDLVPPVTLDAL
jgi:predicted HTH transcriptional regulator